MSSPIIPWVIFSDRVSHWTWTLLPWLDGQRAEDLPVSAWVKFIAMPCYLHGYWRSEAKTSLVHDKHSTPTSPPPTPVLNFPERHLTSWPCCSERKKNAPKICYWKNIHFIQRNKFIQCQTTPGIFWKGILHEQWWGYLTLRKASPCVNLAYFADPGACSHMKNWLENDESQSSGELTCTRIQAMPLPQKALEFLQVRQRTGCSRPCAAPKRTGCLWTLTPGLEQPATVSEITALTC